MPFTVEYTHNKVRGLLSISASKQSSAERAAKATVHAMAGATKELHLDTLTKHDDEAVLERFCEKWRKDRKLPPVTPEVMAENAARVFPQPAEPAPE